MPSTLLESQIGLLDLEFCLTPQWCQLITNPSRKSPDCLLTTPQKNLPSSQTWMPYHLLIVQLTLLTNSSKSLPSSHSFENFIDMCSTCILIYIPLGMIMCIQNFLYLPSLLTTNTNLHCLLIPLIVEKTLLTIFLLTVLPPPPTEGREGGPYTLPPSQWKGVARQGPTIQTHSAIIVVVVSP